MPAARTKRVILRPRTASVALLKVLLKTAPLRNAVQVKVLLPAAASLPASQVPRRPNKKVQAPVIKVRPVSGADLFLNKNSKCADAD